MSDQNECRLVVDGQIYAGWTREEIQTGIEQIAGGFVLQLASVYPYGETPPVLLREGLPCELWIGDDLVISGYIDDLETDDTDTNSSVRISGRDKTGDLVDCSAVHKSGQWRNAKLEQILTDIAKPFDIKVEITPGTSTGEAFKRFALEEGEKAFDAIDRACRLRGVLITSTPQGNLLITTASSKASTVRLEEGVNMRMFNSKHSWKERHSEIILKGQMAGDDFEHGATVAHPKATAKDAEINRYRPLIVMAEQGTGTKTMQERATWEVQVRMGRGKRGGCTVVGWRMGKDGQAGALWRPNTLVHIVSPRMHLDQEMLIVTCAYKNTEQGKQCEMTFARPEAFALVNGIGKSALNAKLNDKTQKEKKKRGDGFTPSWETTPPNPRDKRGAP